MRPGPLAEGRPGGTDRGSRARAPSGAWRPGGRTVCGRWTGAASAGLGGGLWWRNLRFGGSARPGPRQPSRSRPRARQSPRRRVAIARGGSVRARGSSSGNASTTAATRDRRRGRGRGLGQRAPGEHEDPLAAGRTAEGLIALGPLPLEAMPLGAGHAVGLGPGRRRSRPPLHHRFGATEQSQRCSTPAMARSTTNVLSLSATSAHGQSSDHFSEAHRGHPGSDDSDRYQAFSGRDVPDPLRTRGSTPDSQGLARILNLDEYHRTPPSPRPTDGPNRRVGCGSGLLVPETTAGMRRFPGAAGHDDAWSARADRGLRRSVRAVKVRTASPGPYYRRPGDRGQGRGRREPGQPTIEPPRSRPAEIRLSPEDARPATARFRGRSRRDPAS